MKKRGGASFITPLGKNINASEERWDVVVVGLHDPSPAHLGVVAAALARQSKKSRAQIEAALRDGEIPMHTGLRRHEAERAAHELDAIGAAVDLRLSSVTSGAYPILKPDAERRSGTAVGGFIDDSATPPSIAEHEVGGVALEPADGLSGVRKRPVASPQPPVVARRRTVGESPVSVPPMHDPRHPGGRFDPTSTPTPETLERVLADPLDELTSGLDRLTSGDPTDMLLGSIEEETHTDAPRARAVADRTTPRDGYHAPASPGRSRGRAIPTLEPEPSLHADPDRPTLELEVPPSAIATPPPRVAAEPEPPPPRRARGEPARARPTPDAHEDPEPPPPRRPTPARASESGRRPAARAAKPVAAAPLELDFAAAGLSEPPRGTHALAPKAGQSGVLPRRTRAADTGGSGAAAHGIPLGEPRPILGGEPVSATLFGLGIGLGVGLVAAVLLHRGVERGTIAELEEELSTAVITPEEVAKGNAREEASITSDLDAAYADAQRGFLLKWLAIGVPIGLVLGRIKRPS